MGTLSKQTGTLSKQFPYAPTIVKPRPEPVRDMLLKAINLCVNAIKSKKLTIASASCRMSELEGELRQLMQSASTQGIVFEFDAASGLGKISAGQAGATDHIVTTENARHAPPDLAPPGIPGQ